MQARQKILFVGCLYKSKRKAEQFSCYATTCQKTIEQCHQYFPNATFELHIDETLTDADISVFQALGVRVVKHTYPTQQKDYPFSMNSSGAMRRKNCDQLTKCVRLAPLFDKHNFKQYAAVIVIDVHDQFAKTAKLIHAYLAQMSSKTPWALTVWKSTEADCPYDRAVNKSSHWHFDAGLVIAKQALPTRDDMSFIEYCVARIMRSPSRLPKGCEEMLIDDYLKSQSFYEENADKMLRHKHTCQVNPLYFSANLSVTECKPTKVKQSPVIITHTPHSKATNALLSRVDEIYMCTQVPSSKRKR